MSLGILLPILKRPTLRHHPNFLCQIEQHSDIIQNSVTRQNSTQTSSKFPLLDRTTFRHHPRFPYQIEQHSYIIHVSLTRQNNTQTSSTFPLLDRTTLIHHPRFPYQIEQHSYIIHVSLYQIEQHSYIIHVSLYQIEQHSQIIHVSLTRQNNTQTSSKFPFTRQNNTYQTSSQFPLFEKPAPRHHCRSCIRQNIIHISSTLPLLDRTSLRHHPRFLIKRCMCIYTFCIMFFSCQGFQRPVFIHISVEEARRRKLYSIFYINYTSSSIQRYLSKFTCFPSFKQCFSVFSFCIRWAVRYTYTYWHTCPYCFTITINVQLPRLTYKCTKYMKCVMFSYVFACTKYTFYIGKKVHCIFGTDIWSVVLSSHSADLRRSSSTFPNPTKA